MKYGRMQLAKFFALPGFEDIVKVKHNYQYIYKIVVSNFVSGFLLAVENCRTRYLHYFGVGSLLNPLFL